MGIYTTVLYQPILNAFFALYNAIPGNDAGLVIIAITVAVRLILYPFYKKQVKAQKAMQDLQPKIDAIREQYKDDKEQQAQALMSVYKDNKVNPFSSCLPILIQFPLFIAVYQVLRDAFTKPESLDLLYSFVARPEFVDPSFLNILNLSERSIPMAVLAGAAQFWQAKMLMAKKPAIKSEGSKDENAMALMNKQMMYMMPVVIIFIGSSLPSGLALYWLVSTLFMVAQQYIAFKEHDQDAVIDTKAV